MTLLQEAYPVTEDDQPPISPGRAEAMGGSAVGTMLEEPPEIYDWGLEPDQPDQLDGFGHTAGNSHGTAISSHERALWDRQRDVDRSKAGMRFAKHGYTRKERKAEEAKEAVKQEIEIKARRQESGQIPTGSVDGVVNRIRQNMVFNREMKRAVGDAKFQAKLEIRKRELAAQERLEAFREAYKHARQERRRAYIAQLMERLSGNERRTKYVVSPGFLDTEPEGGQVPDRQRSGPRIPTIDESVGELNSMTSGDEPEEVDHSQPNFD